MKIQQCPADRFPDTPAHCLFAMKPHLAFGGMNVHVHLGRVEFGEQTADRVSALHQGGVITFQQGEIKRAVLDGTAVDEQVLVLAGCTRHTGRADESPDPQHRSGPG